MISTNQIQANTSSTQTEEHDFFASINSIKIIDNSRPIFDWNLTINFSYSESWKKI